MVLSDIDPGGEQWRQGAQIFTGFQLEIAINLFFDFESKYIITYDVDNIQVFNDNWASALALLSQFQAFTYLEAWVVGVLQGTQGIWTMALSVIFLKGDERIDLPLIGSVLVVTAGVVLISLQV